MKINRQNEVLRNLNSTRTCKPDHALADMTCSQTRVSCLLESDRAHMRVLMCTPPFLLVIMFLGFSVTTTPIKFINSMNLTYHHSIRARRRGIASCADLHSTLSLRTRGEHLQPKRERRNRSCRTNMMQGTHLHNCLRARGEEGRARLSLEMFQHPASATLPSVLTSHHATWSNFLAILSLLPVLLEAHHAADRGAEARARS